MSKTKPYTKAEFKAWLEKMRGWCDEYVAEGHCTPEDASGDLASSIIGGGSSEEAVQPPQRRDFRP